MKNKIQDLLKLLVDLEVSFEYNITTINVKGLVNGTNTYIITKYCNDVGLKLDDEQGI